MRGMMRTASAAALLLAHWASATHATEPVFDLDPMLHAPAGRIVFNRKCADEEPYQVKAYARMESPDGRGRAVAAVLAGFRATGGRTVHVDVRIQRLRLDAGKEWRSADYTIRLVARSARTAVEGRAIGSYIEDSKGEVRFVTDETGNADWMTFVEPGNEVEGSERFHRFGPELGFTAPDLDVESPQDVFDLALVLQNEANGRTLELQGPRIRVPERIWATNPPIPRALGLLETLNPVQEGGLFRTLGRAWKYRKCIEERRAAKRFLGQYTAETKREGG